MTDRPTITDDARAEAMSRYSFGTYHGQMVQWHDAKKLAVDAFIAGAEWAVARAETAAATPPGLTVSEDGGHVTIYHGAVRRTHLLFPGRERTLVDDVLADATARLRQSRL